MLQHQHSQVRQRDMIAGFVNLKMRIVLHPEPNKKFKGRQNLLFLFFWKSRDHFFR